MDKNKTVFHFKKLTCLINEHYGSFDIVTDYASYVIITWIRQVYVDVWIVYVSPLGIERAANYLFRNWIPLSCVYSLKRYWFDSFVHACHNFCSLGSVGWNGNFEMCVRDHLNHILKGKLTNFDRLQIRNINEMIHLNSVAHSRWFRCH